MTNEEHLEEIVYLAYSLGVQKELMDRVPNYIQYDQRVRVYSEVLNQIATEKNIKVDL